MVLHTAKIRLFFVTLFGALFISACSSTYTSIANLPPENYEVLGKAEGTAHGSLGIFGTAYNAIPMGLNSRVERAYENALESVPGATALINVTYQESWYWWFVATGRAVTVKGTAIKETEK